KKKKAICLPNTAPEQQQRQQQQTFHPSSDQRDIRGEWHSLSDSQIRAAPCSLHLTHAPGSYFRDGQLLEDGRDYCKRAAKRNFVPVSDMICYLRKSSAFVVLSVTNEQRTRHIGGLGMCIAWTNLPIYSP
ncbi:hypothetical protein CDAR_521581, partial [Caerostris darwini]